MTFRDLLEKGEGHIYLVNKSNPTTVTEMDCVMRTLKAFKDEFSNYSYYVGGYAFNPHEFVIARKSKAKNNVFRNGVPKFVSIANNCLFCYPTQRDLGQAKYEIYGSILFLSKEEACNYVIEKIKRKKLDLNAIINKVNKFKFAIAE